MYQILVKSRSPFRRGGKTSSAGKCCRPFHQESYSHLPTGFSSVSFATTRYLDCECPKFHPVIYYSSFSKERLPPVNVRCINNYFNSTNMYLSQFLALAIKKLAKSLYFYSRSIYNFLMHKIVTIKSYF